MFVRNVYTINIMSEREGERERERALSMFVMRFLGINDQANIELLAFGWWWRWIYCCAFARAARIVPDTSLTQTEQEDRDSRSYIIYILWLCDLDKYYIVYSYVLFCVFAKGEGGIM